MTKLEKFKNFEKKLEQILIKHLPNHSIKEGYLWATIPAGKLFRPNLMFSLASDLSEINDIELENLIWAGATLECHHAYSLVHDDLPSMDNDDYRRGKLSVHKKFGEWQAILIGDGLLNLSYHFLSKLKLPNEILALTFKVFSWSMGPKGLIQGQALDLSHEMNHSFENLILTHKLKTSRLIQMSLFLAYLCTKKKQSFCEIKSILRLGENLGIIFQLLDDLSELKDKNLSQHELEINPWLKKLGHIEKETCKRLSKMNEFFKEKNYFQTHKFVSDYLLKMNEIFRENQKQIEINIQKNNLDFNLSPIILLIDRISQINHC